MERDEASIPVVDDALDWGTISYLLDQIMDPMAVAGVDGRIICWNRGAERTLLISKEEAIGQLVSDVVQMDAESVKKSVLEQMAKGRPSWDEAFYLRRRDGTILNLHVTRSIIMNPDGAVVGIVVIFRALELEERARARQKEREDKYAQLFNHMTQGVVYQDSEGSVISMNPSAQRLLGMDLDELSSIGPHAEVRCALREDGSPLNWEEYPSMVALHTGQTVSNMVVGFHDPRENDLRWLKVSSVPLFRRGEERPCQVYTIFDDVTEQKRVQHRAEMERHRMSTILNSLPVGVGISGRDGRLIEVNEMFLQTWGGDLSDERLFSMMEDGHVISPETGVRIGPEDLSLSRSIRSGRPEMATFNIERPGGSVEAVAVSSAPILDHDRSIAGYITVVQNINERSRMENELKRRAMQLSHSNAELQQFAYAASHDLQEPLRMIMCYLGLLEKKYGESFDGQAKEYLGFARDGAQRMRELIDDLLAFSRVETKGRLKTWVKMDVLVGKVIANLQVSIEESGAVVEKEPLPAIWADEVQMVQLMQNLIGNAIKFRRSAPPQIRIRSKTTPLAWTFMVEDNGIGIESKHYERIFQMFQRLHTREEYEGTGIGLAICKKIVERHGGGIWVESEAGKGTTFYFTIPNHGSGVP